MESAKILISLALILGPALVRAEQPIRRPPTIQTFQDEREVQRLNDTLQDRAGFVVSASSLNALIGAAATVSTVTFSVPQPNINYMVFVETNWAANARVLLKTTTGFMIAHDVPGSPKNLSWITVR